MLYINTELELSGSGAEVFDGGACEQEDLREEGGLPNAIVSKKQYSYSWGISHLNISFVSVSTSNLVIFTEDCVFLELRDVQWQPDKMRRYRQ